MSRKIAFRFLAVYLSLYMFPFPFSYLPGVEWVLTPYTSLWRVIIAWTGKSVFSLGYEIPLHETGSGDRIYDYIFLFCILIVSALATLLWSFLDRKRSSYVKLEFWLSIWVRYYLGANMMIYGFVKIFKTQFPFPGLDRLLEPYGDSSPMGLVWTFMGYSPAYNMFTGLGEALAGILLLFRRTTTLGALLAIAIMTNVVMINFGYDVPVKLFSLHLLLVAFLLLIPDLKRLINFFILNKPTAPAIVNFEISDRRLRAGRLAAKALIIIFLLSTNAISGYQNEFKWGDKSPKPVLYGLYDVETFIQNGDTLPSIACDSIRWKRMVVNQQNAFSVVRMDDRRDGFNTKVDTASKTMRMMPQQAGYAYNLSYDIDSSGQLLLTGTTTRDDSVFISLKKRSFLLETRGFHWVNEYPYNR